MTAPTPAVERAALAIYGEWENESMGDEWPVWDADDNLARDTARTWATNTLTAALTDPDDPDSLARTLFGLYHGGPVSGDDEDVRRAWSVHNEAYHAHWRAVADGLRTMLTGQGS